MENNCCDKSAAESFFKALKAGLIYNDGYKSIEQAKATIFEIWYNRK
ncbi:hypothetical protein GCM10011506_39980 [Marivirga lumbricoides]|uniref:Integrase catalytic domain-containing protein n=1 Tax=Marivirga lumbricoides TaxID=1046115 RepID=A0ABQ1MZU0_9BACT|nr:hypothetical protein GCM10011506_39980 [Marivirga lumbricoides]